MQCENIFLKWFWPSLHIQGGPKREPHLFHFYDVNNTKYARKTVVFLVF